MMYKAKTKTRIRSFMLGCKYSGILVDTIIICGAEESRLRYQRLISLIF